MRTTLGDLASRFSGELQGDASVVASGFATDSRAVTPGDVFLAITGENVDGHRFAETAIQSGAVAVVATRPLSVPHILVPNLVDALAALAASYRRGFDGPVIGVTGSAGKTTTKEFLAAALSPLGLVLKNEGNRNTEYTSPLVWSDLIPDHRAVVVEMGMRGFGQVAHLASFSKPTIGVITNVGFSHIELVGSRDGIVKAKGELIEALPSDGTAVVWRDDYGYEVFSRMGREVRSFGYTEEADCRILRYSALGWESAEVEGILDGQAWTARMPVVGKHLALNVAAAVLAASIAGVNPATAAAQIASATLPPMRMEVQDVHGAKVMLDAYNASPPSMVGAIETLAEMPVAGHRRAVVGEMRELGAEANSGHELVGKSIASGRLDDVLLIGEHAEVMLRAAVQAGFDQKKIAVASSLDDVTHFLSRCQPGDAVLVKGSRALELEKAVEAWRVNVRS